MYRVEIYTEAAQQISGLPPEALAAFAQVLDVLELTPWNGDPYSREKPDGVMRQWVFGPDHEGMATYLVLEDQQRVDVVRVIWTG